MDLQDLKKLFKLYIHLLVFNVRSSTKYVSFKQLIEFVADLKQIYTSVDEETALEKLYEFKDKWGK